MKATYAVLVATLCFAGAAEAQDSPFDYRVAFWGGAFFASVDTNFRWDSSLIEGTEIGLESVLDVADNKDTFNGEFEWRFLRRHELNVRYFRLRRDGETDAPFDLVIDGESFPLNTLVQSKFDVDVFALGYAWSFIKTERWLAELGVGLSVQDFTIGIVAQDINITQSGDVTAPLPTLTLGGSWAITPRWIASLKGGWFDLEVDNVRGQISEARADIEWRVAKNVGLNLAYNYFEVSGRVTSEEGGFEGRVDYEFRGPMLGLKLVF